MIPCLIAGVTHTVKLDGSGDFTIIQAALDASSPGDTVLVYPGRYFENLTIQTNNISLMSLEALTGDMAFIDSTVIDANMQSSCLFIGMNKQNISVRGFTFTHGKGTGVGIGQSSVSMNNCKIYGCIANNGGGMIIAGSSVNLSGVKIFSNYAVNLGGGLYASAATGYTNTITFDPVNRCSIYNNRSGSGQDIFIQNATSDLNVYLDTFSVAVPTTYYTIYLAQDDADCHMNIYFQNAHHQEITQDIYVAPDGNDSNDGLSPSSPLKSVHEGIYRIASDSLNQRTVHLLPGTYSRTDNDQTFPIALKSWVKVQGSGIDTTTMICEPHPSIPLSYGSWDKVFQATKVQYVTLYDMTFLARNTENCGVIRGNKGSIVSLKNIRIDSICPDYAAIIRLSSSSDRKTIWENVTIENITTSNAGMINIDLPISGSITNSKFRNSVSTYESASVWAPSLIGIVGDKSLEFDNCQFSNLTMSDDDSNAITISGTEIPQQQNSFSFRNCLFSNIDSQGGVASIASYDNPLIDITNCTFAGNHGDAYTLMVNGDVNIVNSLFYNDTPYQIKVNPMNGNPNELTTLNVDYSNIRDGLTGILQAPGNTIHYNATSISGNPLFLGGDDIYDPLYYSLAAGSPSINTGTPDTLGLDLLPYDLAGNWRVWNGRIDMGCYEYGSAPWVANDDPYIPEVKPGMMLSNYPNPFNPITTISYQLPKSGKVRLDIYNLKGQHISTLVDEAKVAGSHTAIWNGTDSSGCSVASGVYLYRLSFDGMNQTNKMLLMK